MEGTGAVLTPAADGSVLSGTVASAFGAAAAVSGERLVADGPCEVVDVVLVLFAGLVDFAGVVGFPGVAGPAVLFVAAPALDLAFVVALLVVEPVLAAGSAAVPFVVEAFVLAAFVFTPFVVADVEPFPSAVVAVVSLAVVPPDVAVAPLVPADVAPAVFEPFEAAGDVFVLALRAVEDFVAVPFVPVRELEVPFPAPSPVADVLLLRLAPFFADEAERVRPRRSAAARAMPVARS